MTSLSIILTVFVLQIHHVGPHQRAVPRWLRFLCVRILAQMMCMKVPKLPHVYRNYFHNDEVCLTSFVDSVETGSGTTCNGNIHQNSTNTQALKNYKNEMYNDVERDATHQKITNHLKVLVEKQDYEENHQTIVHEWQFVAHVMDRILFWIFLFAAIMSSLVILVVQPLRKPAL